MSRPAQVTIDLVALQHNLEQIRLLAPDCLIMAMVKSNAYGHGLEQVALALPNIDAFGVACSEEGSRLRQAGVKNSIVLMEGLFENSELPKAIMEDFTLVIHHELQIAMLEQSQLKPLQIWLKIDTGMHRLGFAPEEVSEVYHRLSQCSAVKKPIGLMTHFAESDAVDHISTLQQIARFNQATTNLKGPRSLANSAGIIAWPSAHGDWVRPGIMLYGASPFLGHRGAQHSLKPVMTLSSQIIAIHELKKGATVGYGGIWTCPEDMRIGVVAIGYGDGYPRHAQNGTPMLVNNRPCPLIGHVSMDMLTVDLRTQPKASIGDGVTLWGPGLPVELVAEHSGTTAYELLTRITQRVRIVTKDRDTSH